MNYKRWIIDKDGYKQIRLSNKYYREHRVVMEKIIGRKLLVSETVHHKNGIKTDNRECNLEIINNSDHVKKHNQEKVHQDFRDKAVTLYNAGYSANRIEKIFPIGRTLIYKTLKERGIKIRSRWETRRKGKKPAYKIGKHLFYEEIR